MHLRYGRCGKRRPHTHRVSHTSHSDRRYHFNEELPTDSAREAEKLAVNAVRFCQCLVSIRFVVVEFVPLIFTYQPHDFAAIRT